MHAMKRIAVLVAAGLFTLAVPGRAAAATQIFQDSLSPTSVAPGTPVAATLRVHSSACITVQQLGVAVRDSAGNNFDYPGSALNQQICPSGFTLTTGSRTFPAGTYTVFGYFLDSTGYHTLPQSLIVSSGGTSSDPTAGKTVVFNDDFNGPIAFGTRWVGDRTSAYQYGSQNPNDDKLDLLTTKADSVANSAVTFTATPSSQTLVNGQQAWNTGLLTTEGSQEGFKVRTGDYLETRVKLSHSLGAWPAQWTWQNGDNEVDTFAYHPDNPDLLELANEVGGTQDYYTNKDAVAPDKWVVIGTRYGADSVDWFVNGVKVFSDGVGMPANWTAFIILNLSIEAGKFHPAPQNSNPITYSVDYVRVFR